MAQKQKRAFDTRDQAVTYLYNNPTFSGEMLIRESADDLTEDLSHLSKDEEDSHSPDLPVRKDDATHRCLYILNHHGATSPESMLTAGSVMFLSSKEGGFDTKALSTLLHAGYANKRKLGKKPCFYITETGQRLLKELGEPASEITGESVLEF